MTQVINRIERDLIPLKLFPWRISEGWSMLPSYPPQFDADAATMMPDAHSAPDTGSEAHLMTFSVMERRSTASATTLYVTGTLFDLFCYSVNLDRLVEDMEGWSPERLQ